MTTPSTPSITPRGKELDLSMGRPFPARDAARDLLQKARLCALATLDPSGFPYNTITNLIIEPDGTPLFWTADLALHARNIARDPRIAISIADIEGSDMMTAHRLTLVGKAESVSPNETSHLRDLYARRHPKAKLYLGLPDSRLYRLRVESVQINGGPARNANEITPSDFVIDLSGAENLMAAVPALIPELETPETLARLQAMGGLGEGHWRVISIDPEGITLATKLANGRIWFPHRITSAAALRVWLALEETTLEA